MYKTKYKPIDGLPLTETIPMLLVWKGLAPQRVDELTESRIKQANIHRICAGQTKNPGRDVVAPIAEFFGLEFTHLWDPGYVKKYIESDGWKLFSPASALDAARAGVTESSAHSITAKIVKGVVAPYKTSASKEITGLLDQLSPKGKKQFIEKLSLELSAKDSAWAAALFSSRAQQLLEEGES